MICLFQLCLRLSMYDQKTSGSMRPTTLACRESSGARSNAALLLTARYDAGKLHSPSHMKVPFQIVCEHSLKVADYYLKATSISKIKCVQKIFSVLLQKYSKFAKTFKYLKIYKNYCEFLFLVFHENYFEFKIYF